jgi:hypothetical protein
MKEIDKTARVVRRQLEKPAEEAVHQVQQNKDAVFDVGNQIATAEAPADFVNVWSAHTKKGFKS